VNQPEAAPSVEAVAQHGLVFAHRVGLLVLSVALLVLILELVRRGHLKERYALLWLVTAAAGFVIGVFPGIITGLSRVLSFQYLTLLFVVSFLFLLGLVLSFTVVISRLSERNRELTQEVALLEHALRRVEKRLED
jgi:hypothetical protein